MLESNPTPSFVDVTSAAGISHTHHKPILDHQVDNINSWLRVGAACLANVNTDEKSAKPKRFEDAGNESNSPPNGGVPARRASPPK